MATVKLCPTFGAGYQAFTTGGLPLNAGKLYTYAAGGTTPTATYTTSAGSVANANPIILSADGRTPAEVWLVVGTAYRIDVKDSNDNLIQTYDNLTGINDLSGNTTNGTFANLTVSGNTTLSNLTASTALSLDASKVVTSVTNTGTGNNVLATTPTLSTPILGVATATSVDVAGTGAGTRALYLRTGGMLSVYDGGGTERGRISATTTGGGTTIINAVANDAAGELQMLAGKFYMSGMGTTASAANMYVNSGSSPTEQILRSTSSLEFKDKLEDLTLKESQEITFGRHAFSYSSKSEADDPDQRWIGYGAEEIAPVDPRFATFDAEGNPNWVQYERFVVPHGVVLDDHEARIKSLEGLLATALQRIAALEVK